MIIVKTKNGDRFINDKAVAMVEHVRDKAVVNAHGEKGAYYHIEDVEGIIYTNDAQPTHWKDEGSEIQRMKKELDELREWADKMRYEHLQMMQERDELKERLAQLEPKADPDRWWPDNVDSASISIIICCIGRMRRDQGYSIKLEKIFENNNIKTVGDLLRIGSRDFKKYRTVGDGSIRRIDDALETLYDIKSW